MFRARLLTEFILLPPSKPIQKSMSFCLVYMNSESSNTLISTIFQGFAPKKFLHMMFRGRVGVGLSLLEPTDLKHCQNTHRQLLGVGVIPNSYNK